MANELAFYAVEGVTSSRRRGGRLRGYAGPFEQSVNGFRRTDRINSPHGMDNGTSARILEQVLARDEPPCDIGGS